MFVPRHFSMTSMENILRSEGEFTKTKVWSIVYLKRFNKKGEHRSILSI